MYEGEGEVRLALFILKILFKSYLSSIWNVREVIIYLALVTVVVIWFINMI